MTVRGSGSVGRFALKAVIENPRLELVGLWVRYPKGIGSDAGEICGIARSEILATNDADALPSLGADRAILSSFGTGNEDATVALQARLLEARANVVSSSMSA